MRRILPIVFLLALILIPASGVFALPARIDSGYMLLGGTSRGTPDYQTYLRFDLIARTRIPQREYRMFAEQVYSVFLDFPERPNGAFDYRVVMPYGPQRLTINSELFSPVWYEDCVWRIKSSITTPVVTDGSPQVVILSAPFTIAGGSTTFGSYSIGFKTFGRGTLEVKFENLANKYYMKEAYFTFGDELPAADLLSK